MPTKRNKAGYQQPYVEKRHGDESGEYRDNGYGGSATNINHGSNNSQVVNNYNQYQTKPINKNKKNSYNINKEAATDDFRRIQEESRRMSDTESLLYHSARKEIDDSLRSRLSNVFKREIQSRISSTSNDSELLDLGNYKVYTNIDGKLFHDIFEIARKYLENGELVDIHDNYDDATCYLNDDGLSGFAITRNGDLVSVYNLNKQKGGWLRSIAPYVKQNSKTLDCYASSNQNLQLIYSRVFGFKTASIMDYNMEYDHDNIAKNHNMPQVAFMVNTNEPVETKHFTKDQYNEAKEYQMKHIKK